MFVRSFLTRANKLDCLTVDGRRGDAAASAGPQETGTPRDGPGALLSAEGGS